MNKFKDITGEVFGGRTVTGFSHQHPTSRNLYWFYKCECGHEGKTSGTRLRSGGGCPSCAGKVNGRKGLYTQSEGMKVYFIKCNGYVKVGCANNVEERLKVLQVYSPYELELLKVDTENSEEYWHKLLETCHHRGEWYHYGDSCEVVDLT